MLSCITFWLADFEQMSQPWQNAYHSIELIAGIIFRPIIMSRFWSGSEHNYPRWPRPQLISFQQGSPSKTKNTSAESPKAREQDAYDLISIGLSDRANEDKAKCMAPFFPGTVEHAPQHFLLPHSDSNKMHISVMPGSRWVQRDILGSVACCNPAYQGRT